MRFSMIAKFNMVDGCVICQRPRRMTQAESLIILAIILKSNCFIVECTSKKIKTAYVKLNILNEFVNNFTSKRTI